MSADQTNHGNNHQTDNTVSDSFEYGGRMLTVNTVYNLLGRILPLIIAVLAIPFLVRGLGVDRFGVLMLAWMVVGYFGIFDMGITRATTKYVAEALQERNSKKVSRIVWSSLILLIGLGIIGSITAIILMPWLVNDVLKIPVELKKESLTAFIILSVSLPFVLGTTGIRAALEGMHKFKIVNSIKVPASMYSFLAPLLVLIFTTNLVYIVSALVAGRIIVFLIHAGVCITCVLENKKPLLPNMETIKQLMGFGAWMTITIGVGSFMSFGYVDRFMISTVLNMESVTYHATPFEMAIKMLVVTGGVLGVLFPVFSAYAKEQQERMMILHQRVVKILLFCLGPLSILVITFAKPILHLWLDADFAAKSALVLQIIMYGVLINSLSLTSSSALQALNRPDLTAKRVLAVLPLYIIADWICTAKWGIAGTACVWTGWVIVDILILYVILRRLVPDQSRNIRLGFTAVLVAVCGIPVISVLFTQVSDVIVRIFVSMAVLSILLLGFWKYGFNSEDRSRIKTIFKPVNLHK